MAGGLFHVVNHDTDDWSYRGTELLENMGDMAEAVDEMAFMLLSLRKQSPMSVNSALEQYNRCCRGEEPWPDWFNPQ